MRARARLGEKQGAGGQADLPDPRRHGCLIASSY
jgi:hypothetical protein